MDTTVLAVQEQQPGDVGKGIGRMRRKTMRDLGLEEGTPVMLKGQYSTECVVVLEADVPANTIAIDAKTREHLGITTSMQVGLQQWQYHELRYLRASPVEMFRLKNPAHLMRLNLIGRAFTRDQRFYIEHNDHVFGYIVDSYAPMKRIGIVTDSTTFEVAEEPTPRRARNVAPAAYSDVGGLEDELRSMRELIEYPLFQPEIFDHLGTQAPRGVLLFGPPGTGKTLMARAIAHESFTHFIPLSATDLILPMPGATEKELDELFTEARQCAPSIIYIDEIDAIAAAREDAVDPTTRNAVTALLSHMDGMHERGQVVVIGSTNRPQVLDEAIRRPGRFDREVYVGAPDKGARREIVNIHTKAMPLEGVDLEKLAAETHGFTGADIQALCREAAMSTLRKVQREDGDDIPNDEIVAMRVHLEDFESAAEDVGPSVLRDDAIDVPDVCWEDIGGLDEAKQQLMEAVEWPMLHEDIFNDMNVSVPSGALMYGPPGTGKTMLAKAIANSANANFISVKGPEFLDKYVGETERKVREVFRKARQAQPCVLFFDEADSIMPARRTEHSGTQVMERTISTFLAELDGMEELNGVFVLAATNRPELMDAALLRPGRLSRHIFIGPPNQDARTAIFEIYLAKVATDGTFTSDEYSDKTEGWTGADINNVVNEAKMLAIREFVEERMKGKKTKLHAIGNRHMEKALETCKPRGNSRRHQGVF